MDREKPAEIERAGHLGKLSFTIRSANSSRIALVKMWETTLEVDERSIIIELLLDDCFH